MNPLPSRRREKMKNRTLGLQGLALLLLLIGMGALTVMAQAKDAPPSPPALSPGSLGQGSDQGPPGGEEDGPLDLLLERPALAIGLGLGIVGLLGVGNLGAVFVTRSRPGSTRLVWSGCAASLLLTVTLAVLGVLLAKPDGSSLGRKASGNATPVGGTKVAELVSGGSPTEVPATQPLPTSTPTRLPPTVSATATSTTDPHPTCSGAPRQGLEVGDRIYVCTQADRLSLRTRAGLASSEVTKMDPGTDLSIIDGPSCEDGWLWWRVRTDRGEVGWVAEGEDEVDPRYICKASSCAGFTGPFARVASAMEGEIGCQTGGAFRGFAAEEHFEGGIMLWREDLDHARSPVLYNDGTWRYYAHTPFVEGSPEFSCVDANTPAQCPPTPKRGFGMMWCDIPELRQRLGDAVDCERGFDATMQSFTEGFLLQNDRGQLYALFDDGTWRTLR
jgi:hypothetical protein